jgi:hypothetical protein
MIKGWLNPNNVNRENGLILADQSNLSGKKGGSPPMSTYKYSIVVLISAIPLPISSFTGIPLNFLWL